MVEPSAQLNPVNRMCLCLLLQINEKASDEVLEVEKKYNEVRKPVYEKRNDIIKSIPDFWLTAVSTFSGHFSCRHLLI